MSWWGWLCAGFALGGMTVNLVWVAVVRRKRP